MTYFKELGILSYVGAILILLFIISIFLKKDFPLFKSEKIQYDKLKLDISWNILVLLLGIFLLYFEYNNNYNKLDTALALKITDYKDLEIKKDELEKEKKLNLNF